jgi:hypothetical protein
MKRRNAFSFILITAVVFAVFSSLNSQVSAVTIFTSRSAWESAVGSFVTEDFDALAPFEFSTGLNSVGLIDVYVTGPDYENQLGGPSTLGGQFAINGTNHLIGHVLDGGTTHPTVIFPYPIIGFAADWRSTTTGGHLLTMTFDNTTIHFDDYLSDDGTGFLGIKATNTFTQAVFGTETTYAEAFGMDNLSITPEPATVTLLGLGALRLIRRKRRV